MLNVNKGCLNCSKKIRKMLGNENKLNFTCHCDLYTKTQKYFYVKYEDNQLATDTWQTIFAVEIFTSKMKVLLLLLSFALRNEA